MNKNIKEVLVRVEYHGQIWYEYISIEIFYATKEQFTVGGSSRHSQPSSDWPNQNSNSKSSPRRPFYRLQNYPRVPVVGVDVEAKVYETV